MSTGDLRSARRRRRPRPAIGLVGSSGDSRRSTRTISAPISASSIDAKGAAPIPANSTRRIPLSGPDKGGFCSVNEFIVNSRLRLGQRYLIPVLTCRRRDVPPIGGGDRLIQPFASLNR